jgi:hypothetical protein
MTPPAHRSGGSPANVAARNLAPRGALTQPTSPSPQFDAARIARGLGWFSSALGSIEVLARGVVARAIGTRGSSLARMVTRVCGLREAASCVGILTAPRPEITAT